MTDKTLDSHIEITPGICGGKPRIAGRRITVAQIVVWHERQGKSADEIAAEYALELADIYSALAYYYDRQTEIDLTLQESQDWIENLRRNAPSALKQKLRQPSDE